MEVLYVLLIIVSITALGLIHRARKQLDNLEKERLKIPTPAERDKNIEKILEERAQEIKRLLIYQIKNEISDDITVARKKGDDLAIELIKKDFEDSNWKLILTSTWIKAVETEKAQNVEEVSSGIYR